MYMRHMYSTRTVTYTPFSLTWSQMKHHKSILVPPADCSRFGKLLESAPLCSPLSPREHNPARSRQSQPEHHVFQRSCNNKPHITSLIHYIVHHVFHIVDKNHISFVWRLFLFTQSYNLISSLMYSNLLQTKTNFWHKSNLKFLPVIFVHIRI